ncbi:MAG: hypothetical protein KDK27_10060, partial [Leptospiraceae bacterium]|nr:hypothetical protein [Leptospiraceae bacterium]
MNEKLNLQAPDLWYSAAFEAYPAVIAHEYWRLYDLLENKQVYGALLQIKDLFEVILKLPVLVYAAHLYRKERAPGENRLLLALLDQLSLGTWLGIGRQMYNQLELPDAASDINEHLKAVLDLFEKHKIVSWRNDVIGHGALSLNEAHDLESDIASLLRALRDFFQTQDQLYQTLVLRLQNAETYKSESDITDGILRGRAGARSLHRKEDDSGDPTERERLSVEYQDFHIELYPFAFVQAGDIFFFDGFILRKDKSDIISYPPGYRRSEHLPEILDLTQSVRRQEQDAALGGGYSGNTYLAENRKVIESIFTVEDFRKPVYLMDWLRESVLKQTGGVFHLQMEMGTGKSTFARALDETRRTGNMKIDFKNLTVRGYFLNDSYLASVQAFCNSINDFFNRDKHGDRTFESQETDLPNVQSGSETPREDVAALLNFYRDRYEWHYGTTRLLFIIDGLAEIPADQSRSIMDFIPTRDLLNDGVFVLLTSRPVYELPAHVRDAAILQPDNITGAKTIDRNDAEYQCVLSEYAQKEILEPLQLADRVQPDMLMHKSEFRFLYMRLYRELLKSYGDNLPSSLPEGALLLEQYLERLRKLYGDKFYQHLSTLLAILASAYEPLTLAEIAYLSGRDEPDFKMLAYLADLRGFFKTERSYRGNLISLHQEWKEGARSLLDETIRMLVRQWIDDCLSLPKEKLNAENDGMTYLFSYLHEYAENYCKVAKLAADTGIRLLTAFERFSGNDQQIYLLQRQRRITESALGVFTDSGENSMLFAKAEEYRGDVEFSLKEKLHGHGFYSSAILHLNQLPESDRQDCRGQLLQLFSKRASAALNIKTYRQHAIEDCDRAIQLFNELKADGCKLDVFSLVKIYSDRSTACVFEARYEDAVSDCDFAIQLLEETSSDKNDNQHVSSLARLFLNRGRARYHSGQLSEAYDDCSEAIRLIEKSQAARFLNEALFLKGSICFKLGDVEHAIGAYSHAIEQFEDMQRKGHVVD